MSYLKYFGQVLILILVAGILFANAFQTGTVTYDGQLKVGKTESTIIYLGSESGDLAAFCFTNKSRVGRAILSKCKDGKQCEFTGRVSWAQYCDIKKFYPPDTEMQGLSASGKIVSLKSVRIITKKRR